MVDCLLTKKINQEAAESVLGVAYLLGDGSGGPPSVPSEWWLLGWLWAELLSEPLFLESADRVSECGEQGLFCSSGTVASLRSDAVPARRAGQKHCMFLNEPPNGRKKEIL